MTLTPRFTVTHPVTSALTRIERARGFLEAATLSEDWVVRMQERALVLEAHHTTHIEGTRLELHQSEKLLAGEEVAGVDPDDARELLNYREAFDLVAGYLDSGDPVTEALIREIHKRLVRGVRGDAAAPGEYRRIQNYVVNSSTGEVLYTPPPAYELPRLMAELVEWLRGEREIHAVLMAGIAQFHLVHIHPFLDGNGRTARLLSTLWLYRTGYDFKRLFTLSEYYDRDRRSYYRAIQSVRESDLDLTSWLEYFTEGLAVQLQEVQERGARVIRQDVMLMRAARAGFGDRPQRILAFLRDRGRGRISELEETLGVQRRTLQRELKRLIEEGFVVERASSATDPTRYYELFSYDKL